FRVNAASPRYVSSYPLPVSVTVIVVVSRLSGETVIEPSMAYRSFSCATRSPDTDHDSSVQVAFSASGFSPSPQVWTLSSPGWRAGTPRTGMATRCAAPSVSWPSHGDRSYVSGFTSKARGAGSTYQRNGFDQPPV